MKQYRAFTLLELLIAVGIAVIVGLGITELFIVSWKFQNTISKKLSAEQDGRRSLREFTGDVRAATYSATGAYPLETVEAGKIVFYANIDNDPTREKVRYFIEGGSLKKGVTEPSGNPPAYNMGGEIVSVLATGVVNGLQPLFTYYDQSYSGAQSPLPAPVEVTKVRVVGFEVRLGNPAVPLVLSTKVAVRNLKSN